MGWSCLSFVLRRLLGHPCGYKPPGAFLEGCFGQCSGEVRGFILIFLSVAVLEHPCAAPRGQAELRELPLLLLSARLGLWSPPESQDSKSLSKHISVLVLGSPRQALTQGWFSSGVSEGMGLLQGGFGASAGFPGQILVLQQSLGWVL